VLPAAIGAPLAPASAPIDRISDPNLVVPVGEFESSAASAGKLRTAHAHATVTRDAVDALLQIPDAPATRDDPTTIDRNDPTAIKAPSDGMNVTGGRLRRYAQLRRQRGIVGDVRYVFTVLLGVRRSRRELAELEQRQVVRQASRRRHLITLGRSAVSAESLRNAALADARDALAAVEDERSKQSGAVAASDAELERVRRDRSTKQAEHAAAAAAGQAELAEVTKKLEPLEKEAAAVRKRADELRAALARVDKQIADTEASRHSVKTAKEPAAIAAELASLRADRNAVQRDEPRIAAELDALNPRLAALEAARGELRNTQRERDEAETLDQRRTAELLDAIGAKRKVVERAAGEAETARDRVLFELGERLYVDRPEALAPQLAPIDTIDLELGETDRRIMELREILSNVDRAKLARGTAVVAAGALAVALLVTWIVLAI
jgi:hypothetical protein